MVFKHKWLESEQEIISALSKILKTGIRDALESGVLPEHYIFRSYYSSFTLRQYLSFLIEILDEVKNMACAPNGRSKSFQLFQDIAVAEVFRDFNQA